MNGLSSDVYVYDTETQTIRQISSGPEEIQWLIWSPDGNRILHGSTYEAGEGIKCRIYIADLDGTPIRYLSENQACYHPGGWVNKSTYVEYDAENGLGTHYLGPVDIQTGNISALWIGSFNAFALDSQQGLLAIDKLAIFPIDNFKEGLYLINIASGQQTLISDGDWLIMFFGFENHRFTLSKWEGRSYVTHFFLNGDGSLTPIENNVIAISAAPDQKHWVEISDKILVFTSNDTLVREVHYRRL
jgi:WD40 repeat protein